MKLRGKTSIPLLVLFVASIASVVGVIVYQQSKVLREDVIELSRQIARTESQKMATLLDKAYYVGDSLSYSFEEFAKLDGDAKREFALRSLKGALASNREFVGTWACFEPNAFDGRDVLLPTGIEPETHWLRWRWKSIKPPIGMPWQKSRESRS